MLRKLTQIEDEMDECLMLPYRGLSVCLSVCLSRSWTVDECLMSVDDADNVAVTATSTLRRTLSENVHRSAARPSSAGGGLDGSE